MSGAAARTGKVMKNNKNKYYRKIEKLVCQKNTLTTTMRAYKNMVQTTLESQEKELIQGFCKDQKGVN